MYRKATTSYPAGGLCLICKHWISGGNAGYWICSAFPDGMPEAIANAHVDHRYLFPGDNGIHFEFDDETYLSEGDLADTIKVVDRIYQKNNTKLLQGFQYLRRHHQMAWKAFEEGRISQDELLDALTEWLLRDWLDTHWLIGGVDAEWFKLENNLWIEAAPPFSTQALDAIDPSLDQLKEYDSRLLVPAHRDIPDDFSDVTREIFQRVNADHVVMWESRRTFLRERYFDRS